MTWIENFEVIGKVSVKLTVELIEVKLSYLLKTACLVGKQSDWVRLWFLVAKSELEIHHIVSLFTQFELLEFQLCLEFFHRN